jgi:hypothetical protein
VFIRAYVTDIYAWYVGRVQQSIPIYAFFNNNHHNHNNNNNYDRNDPQEVLNNKKMAGSCISVECPTGRVPGTRPEFGSSSANAGGYTLSPKQPEPV